MAEDEKDRMETDEEGKQIAADFFKHFGYVVTATTYENDRLDGAFNTKIGIIGLEVKNMSVDRYTNYNDIPIAANKYDYSINDGKMASGLTKTFKLDYVKTEDGIVCMITDFAKCKLYKPQLKNWPIGNYKGAPKRPQWIHFIPREEMRSKWLITNNKIIKL